MYCTACGANNPASGKYCHECGSKLVTLNDDKTQPIPIPNQLSEEDVLRRILQTDPRPNQCHRCGSRTELTSHEFGIAKVLSTKRDWSETAIRLGASAASLALAPIIGFGGVSWKSPDKTTSYRLLKTKLVLCRSCLSEAWKTAKGTALKTEAYHYHPWAEKARQGGYDKFLSAGELKKLTPARGKAT
jgi:RNA polymerase subunit RPABC4/transcription elongation factor Spt4